MTLHCPLSEKYLIPPPAIGLAASLQAWLDALKPEERELLALQLKLANELNGIPLALEAD